MRPRAAGDPGALPARARIAVIGGGVAGLATAWALGERGEGDVVVVERDDALAGHASARNAAIGRALADDDAWTAVTAPGAAILRAPPPALAAGPLIDGRGVVLLAAPPVATGLLARAARFGIACEPIDAAAVARRWPGLAARGGGVWCPDDGAIELAALIDGLARGARAAGARLVTGAEVTAIAPRAGGVVVTTARGAIRVDQVVIAAGAWSDDVAARGGAPGVGLVARRRHLVAVRARAPDAPIVWQIDGDEWYARPAGDEVWASPCDGDAAVGDVVDARAAAVAALRARPPAALAAAPVARAWACRRTFAAGPPVVARDRARPWLVRVVGLGGHGVTACVALGRAAAAVLLA